MMLTATSTDLTIADALTKMEQEASAMATEQYTETLSPILRKVGGYTGDFTVQATSKMTIDTETGIIDNKMTLALAYPDNGQWVDPFETAQRIILAEALRMVIDKYMR